MRARRGRGRAYESGLIAAEDSVRGPSSSLILVILAPSLLLDEAITILVSLAFSKSTLYSPCFDGPLTVPASIAYFLGAREINPVDIVLPFA